MSIKSVKYCCESMEYHAKFKCEIHKSPFECPDSIIYYSNSSEIFGIIIHDGGESFISIKYCPWCGTQIDFSDDDNI
jgi:hypothetical protein